MLEWIAKTNAGFFLHCIKIRDLLEYVYVDLWEYVFIVVKFWLLGKHQVQSYICCDKFS